MTPHQWKIFCEYMRTSIMFQWAMADEAHAVSWQSATAEELRNLVNILNKEIESHETPNGESR